MITLTNVNKTLKNKTILNEVNLNFKEGKIYLVEGHNGCGKTMLLRMICGLIKPTSGTVEYEKDYDFGAIIENPAFINTDTGLENLKFLANITKKIGDEEILSTLDDFGLAANKNQKVKTYSLGMKQRLGICQAVMEDQDVILLDEPFNALDKESYLNVINLINKMKKENKILVIAAHNIERKELLDIDETIEMNNGSII